MESMFFGTGTALVTPFSGGKVDAGALEGLIRRQLDANVDALIVCGTTGESATLTDGEMCKITEAAKALAVNRVPVIAGAGSNNTQTAVRRAKRMAQAGADALLCVTPYYNRANREGIIAHYTAIAEAAQLPLILYNVPGRTGLNLENSWAEALFKHPLIRGVKEASGDILKAASLIHALGGSGYVYCGNDHLTLPMMALGASGVISVASNVAPERMRALTYSALKGDFLRAREAHSRLLPIFDACCADVNPIPVKAMLAAMGLIKNELRLPLTPLSPEKMKALEGALKDAGEL